MATDGGAAEKDMICCSECCFFRSDCWCYKKLRYVRPNGQICSAFLGGATITLTIDELSEKVDDFVRQAEIKPREEPKKADDRPTCLSCGNLLYIERRGRDGYCAECGCYIPRIVYDKTVPEAPQWVPRLFPENNPMTITRPKPMPTVKCRG